MASIGVLLMTSRSASSLMMGDAKRSRPVSLASLEGAEGAWYPLPSDFQERFGKPGKSCDMDTVASVSAAWNDAAEEHDILSALLHCYRIILDLAAAI